MILLGEATFVLLNSSWDFYWLTWAPHDSEPIGSEMIVSDLWEKIRFKTGTGKTKLRKLENALGHLLEVPCPVVKVYGKLQQNKVKLGHWEFRHLIE